MFEFRDIIISENSFIRTILDTRFTFKDSKLISTEILKGQELILLILLFLILIKFPENYIYFNLSVIPIKNVIKLRKVKSKNIWTTLNFNINNLLFTKGLFQNIFNKFWNSIENKFNDNNHLFILLKIKYLNNEFATIGNLQRLNKEDKE